MPVTVWKGLVRALRSQGTIMLLARSGADPERLDEALRAATADIEKIGYWVTPPDPADPDSDEWEGVEVTGPVPSPSGSLLLLHAGNTPPQMKIGDIPEILTRRLEEAGITDAKISRGKEIGDRYENLESFGPLARAVICGTGRVLPNQPILALEPRLISLAESWLLGNRRPERELLALLISAEIPVTFETLDLVVMGGLKSLDKVTVIASDFATGAASIILGECMGQGVALSVHEAGWRAADLTVGMREHRDLIRVNAHLREVSWAYVTAEPENRYLWVGEGIHPDEWRVDAHWYQLLSQERLQRLGGAPPGAVQLPGGRFELTVGEPEQWVPGHPDREIVRDQGRRLLAAGT